MKRGGQSSNVRAGETTTKAGVLPREGRRRLIWVPIIHTEADLGNMAGSVRDLYVRKMGPAKWARHVADIGRLWSQIRERIEGMRLEYAKVRLYQDGLPNCGQEKQIVADLARAGSQNHQLLADLMARGAAIMGTETLRPGETGLIFLGMLHSLAGRLPPDIEVIR